MFFNLRIRHKASHKIMPSSELHQEIPTKLTKLFFIILSVLRFYGLTFGGITIDSKVRIATNKWLKLYGYLVVVLYISFDICHILFSTTIEYEYDKPFTEMPPNIAIPFRIFMAILVVGWNAFKVILVIFINGKQGKILIEPLFEIIKSELTKKTKIFMTMALLFTLGILLIITVVNVTLAIFSNTLLDIYSIIFQFASTLYYYWILSFMIWIISIYYSQKLDQINNDVELFINIKQTGIYLIQVHPQPPPVTHILKLSPISFLISIAGLAQVLQ